MTTKQKTTGVAAAAVTALGILATTIFVGNRYDAQRNVVQTDLADDYCTVLIYKGDGELTDVTGEDIVYVDQDDETFSKAEEFILRADIEPGEYTMLMNKPDGGKPLRKTFYIAPVASELDTGNNIVVE